MDEIEARALVRAPREAVFEYLSTLEHHWQLADRWIDVLDLNKPPATGAQGADRGVVRMHGPLGLRRTVATRVDAADPPRAMSGVAEVGPRTKARMTWTLEERDGETEVRLTARVDEAAALDRLLLALGGRAWLARRFNSVLARLATRFG